MLAELLSMSPLQSVIPARHSREKIVLNSNEGSVGNKPEQELKLQVKITEKA